MGACDNCSAASAVEQLLAADTTDPAAWTQLEVDIKALLKVLKSNLARPYPFGRERHICGIGDQDWIEDGIRRANAYLAVIACGYSKSRTRAEVKGEVEIWCAMVKAELRRRRQQGMALSAASRIAVLFVTLIVVIGLALVLEKSAILPWLDKVLEVFESKAVQKLLAVSGAGGLLSVIMGRVLARIEHWKKKVSDFARLITRSPVTLGGIALSGVLFDAPQASGIDLGLDKLPVLVRLTALAFVGGYAVPLMWDWVRSWARRSPPGRLTNPIG